jgi:hypothetical protein
MTRALFVATLILAAGPVATTPLSPVGISAQQVADTAFRPPLGEPAFPPGEGPRVVLDEAHVNFHTLEGRYATFARVLRRDGFVVEPGRGPLVAAALGDADIVVIANALNEANEGNWRLPTPSAFTAAEIRALREWVELGGSLLLIADHMPFPGAAASLAAAFGFELMNGFAFTEDPAAPLVFRTSDGSLADHAVVRGRAPAEGVDSVVTFTGQAFRPPAGATSLLTLPEGAVSLNPVQAWQFTEETPRVDVSGWSQGAVLDVGEGRVAVFGEAAMFSAQRAGPERVPMGMNAPLAAGNPQFLVNLARWLGRAPESPGRTP